MPNYLYNGVEWQKHDAYIGKGKPTVLFDGVITEEQWAPLLDNLYAVILEQLPTDYSTLAGRKVRITCNGETRAYFLFYDYGLNLVVMETGNPIYTYSLNASNGFDNSIDDGFGCAIRLHINVKNQECATQIMVGSVGNYHIKIELSNEKVLDAYSYNDSIAPVLPPDNPNYSYYKQYYTHRNSVMTKLLLADGTTSYRIYNFDADAEQVVYDGRLLNYALNSRYEVFYWSDKYQTYLSGYRFVDWTSSQYTYEPDPDHPEWTAEDYGIVGEIVWSNTDIYNPDGTLYLPASDPVPVYDTTDAPWIGHTFYKVIGNKWVKHDAYDPQGGTS